MSWVKAFFKAVAELWREFRRGMWTKRVNIEFDKLYNPGERLGEGLLIAYYLKFKELLLLAIKHDCSKEQIQDIQDEAYRAWKELTLWLTYNKYLEEKGKGTKSIEEIAEEVKKRLEIEPEVVHTRSRRHKANIVDEETTSEGPTSEEAPAEGQDAEEL